ncbi:MAG: CinA family protein [Candidatus Omnitrophica bacterium]|jgi:nicotinamide-nucleotide amidase|nr:CinA family protein [Candidatus Omnitrophota bacterium]
MLNKLANQLHHKLLKRKKTISVAESCTGGLLSSLLTKYPQASAYFLLGLVTYSNNSKEQILGIPKKIINQYGAVSEKTARLMAKNIRKKTNADFGVSITGIAGPTGATSSKPKGTVYIGLASKNKIICRLFLLPGNRQEIRRSAALKAIRLLAANL